MHLPENLRDSLKTPMGVLVPNSRVTKENVLKIIPKDAFLITVGDATTEKVIKFGLDPSLQIVDSMEKRHRRQPPAGSAKIVMHCTNPAGQITTESLYTIKKAFEEKKEVSVRILVDGEEDLLVLPVVLHAPENSVVMYGQPNEGLVIVTVNDKARQSVKKIMDMMI